MIGGRVRRLHINTSRLIILSEISYNAARLEICLLCTRLHVTSFRFLRVCSVVVNRKDINSGKTV